MQGSGLPFKPHECDGKGMVFSMSISRLDALRNNGVLVLNKRMISSRERTVIVLGVARGGTTMVASVLQALGTYMGECPSVVLEDVELSSAIETGSTEMVMDIIGKRNARFPVWGWKRPSALDYAEVWRNCFRNPHFIAVFRDPFAIANRNRISMLSDIFDGMEDSLTEFGKLIAFLKGEKSPILMCSYEKALAMPENFVSAVDDFLGLGSERSWESAIHRIRPEATEYLENARITKAFGYLDSANTQFCDGWAFYEYEPERAAEIEIFVNGTFLFTTTAGLFRKDLIDSGLHRTGLVGFRFDWPLDFKLTSGDRVSARAAGDIHFLHNSPMAVIRLPNIG